MKGADWSFAYDVANQSRLFVSFLTGYIGGFSALHRPPLGYNPTARLA
jgi:hypothetical protein